MFKKFQGVTKGYPISSTIFNILANAVVWATFLEVCSPQEYHHGMGWAEGDQDIVFCADNGRIVGRNPIWVQGALTTLVWTFEKVVIYMNLGNTKAMSFTPGFVWRHLGKDSHKRQSTGEGDNIWEHKWTMVICN